MSTVDREASLRAGKSETIQFGNTIIYLSWGPHFPDTDKPAVQDFHIEWYGGPLDRADREYFHDFDAAVKRLEEIERQIAIDGAVLALLGPQDTVQIRRPPQFKP